MVEPPRTHVTKVYTLCYLCNDVVREGSKRFDVFETPRTSTLIPCTPCFPSNDVDRKGSEQSNHSELM